MKPRRRNLEGGRGFSAARREAATARPTRDRRHRRPGQPRRSARREVAPDRAAARRTTHRCRGGPASAGRGVVGRVREVSASGTSARGRAGVAAPVRTWRPVGVATSMMTASIAASDNDRVDRGVRTETASARRRRPARRRRQATIAIEARIACCVRRGDGIGAHASGVATASEARRRGDDIRRHGRSRHTNAPKSATPRKRRSGATQPSESDRERHGRWRRGPPGEAASGRARRPRASPAPRAGGAHAAVKPERRTVVPLKVTVNWRPCRKGRERRRRGRRSRRDNRWTGAPVEGEARGDDALVAIDQVSRWVLPPNATRGADQGRQRGESPRRGLHEVAVGVEALREHASRWRVPGEEPST